MNREFFRERRDWFAVQGQAEFPAGRRFLKTRSSIDPERHPLCLLLLKPGVEVGIVPRSPDIVLGGLPWMEEPLSSLHPGDRPLELVPGLRVLKPNHVVEGAVIVVFRGQFPFHSNRLDRPHPMTPCPLDDDRVCGPPLRFPGRVPV